MKSLITLLFLITVSYCAAQTALEDCGCDKLTERERESIQKHGNSEVTFSYPNGKIKYQEIKKGKKIHITCYQQTGDKCREIFSNTRTKIKKTIYYDPLGKKYMVCKGKLNP